MNKCGFAAFTDCGSVTPEKNRFCRQLIMSEYWRSNSDIVNILAIFDKTTASYLI